MLTQNWLSDAVFYQIMPDRFARAGTAGAVLHEGAQVANAQASAPSVQLQDWAARPGASGRGVREFFGGNLRGMLERLDHVREIGANAILLTPINRAPTFHRYDTVDFRALDPLLGTWDDLSALIARAHDRGIKVVFDIALNHVSREHPWFQAALRDPAAPERGYFRFLENGQYLCWWGHADLPELQLGHPALQEELFLGDDSVLSFWFDKGFDGVRLDCANDLTYDVCQKIAARVKARYPGAAVIGEVSNYSVPWLDVLDGTQSYFFTASLEAVWQRRISHQQLQKNLQMAYGTGAYGQFQMLSSHDTPRAHTKFAADPDFLRAARRLQFTLPGIPMVYYGEEFALEGGRDPDNRGTVPWDQWPSKRDDASTRELLRLIELRHSSPELRRGAWEPLTVEGVPGLLAFFRAHRDDPARFTLVVWNDDAEARRITLTIPWGWLYSEVQLREVFTGRTAAVSCSLLTIDALPRECSIWQINGGNKGPYSFFKDWRTH